MGKKIRTGKGRKVEEEIRIPGRRKLYDRKQKPKSRSFRYFAKVNLLPNQHRYPLSFYSYYEPYLKKLGIF